MLVKEFVNADEIAKGLSPFNPEGVVIEAGRLMLRRIEDLLEMGESFSIETTLATRSYINLVRRAQEKGPTIPARPVRRGYTTRLREGALISFCSLVASASVILLLGQKF